MTTATSTASRKGARIRRNGSRLLAAGLAAFALAGCGGDDSGDAETTAATGFAAEVEQAIGDLGTTQEISCESLGTVSVAGTDREVARCSFTEEKEASGEMRARGGCFVIEAGAPLEVTDEVPADVTCFTTG